MNGLVESVGLGDVALRLVAAIIVGGLLGLNREWSGKKAGVRTLALVSLGAALVSVSTVHLSALQAEPNATSRVVQGIIQGVMTGVGFIGAGVIFHGRHDVHGLTTAATVWVAAALGIACALATWDVVLIGGGLTLAVLISLKPLDALLERKREDGARGEEPSEDPAKRG